MVYLWFSYYVQGKKVIALFVSQVLFSAFQLCFCWQNPCFSYRLCMQGKLCRGRYAVVIVFLVLLG